MAAIQVKNLPDDLHEALRRRAAAEGISLSELVTRTLRREAALPSLDEWLVRARSRPRSDVDGVRAVEEARDELGL
jgi:plasmid stability protein